MKQIRILTLACALSLSACGGSEEASDAAGINTVETTADAAAADASAMDATATDTVATDAAAAADAASEPTQAREMPPPPPPPPSGGKQ